MNDVEFGWSRIAREMLGCPEPTGIHDGLVKEMDAVDALAQAAGGTLYSRQLIAFIIVDWQRRNPDKNAIPDKKYGW